MSISLCSDRFPHRCLKGIIRVTRAVIFEVAVFLLLSLFWTNHQPPSPPRQPPTTISTTAFTTTTSPHHPLIHISPNKPTTNNIASPSSPKRRHLCAGHGESASNSGAAQTEPEVSSPCRVVDFNHVRSVQASPEIRIKTTEGAEPAGGQRSEVKTSPHRLHITARGAPSAVSLWSVCRGSESLEPGACSRWRS